VEQNQPGAWQKGTNQLKKRLESLSEEVVGNASPTPQRGKMKEGRRSVMINIMLQ
jgi:hypothetical protein